MYEPSKNTVYIAIAFTSIAALVGTCAYWDDISYALCDVVKPELNNGEVRLVDDEGKSYTLINHGNGKETALYDDAEKSVTFHRLPKLFPQFIRPSKTCYYAVLESTAKSTFFHGTNTGNGRATWTCYLIS